MGRSREEAAHFLLTRVKCISHRTLRTVGDYFAIGRHDSVRWKCPLLSAVVLQQHCDDGQRQQQHGDCKGSGVDARKGVLLEAAGAVA